VHYYEKVNIVAPLCRRIYYFFFFAKYCREDYQYPEET
jgi:hypothetical protein